MEEDNIHDLFCILYQHEDQVKSIVVETKIVIESLALMSMKQNKSKSESKKSKVSLVSKSFDSLSESSNYDGEVMILMRI